MLAHRDQWPPVLHGSRSGVVDHRVGRSAEEKHKKIKRYVCVRLLRPPDARVALSNRDWILRTEFTLARLKGTPSHSALRLCVRFTAPSNDWMCFNIVLTALTERNT